MLHTDFGFGEFSGKVFVNNRVNNLRVVSKNVPQNSFLLLDCLADVTVMSAVGVPGEFLVLDSSKNRGLD